MIDIKKFRKQNKYTQIQFGEMLGYTHAYISNIENRKEPITDNFLDKLHEVFGMDVEEYKSYNREKVIHDPGIEYRNEWRDKYYELLEKYNHCLEEKEELLRKNKGS